MAGWLGFGRRAAWIVAGLGAVVATATAAKAWTPVPVHDDPLVHQPGTQPEDGVTLEAPTRCLNCHSGYDAAVEPGSHWKGSMMAQAARDPLFFAAVTVAAQDAIWAVGNPNATDLCLRCHSPSAWLGGRSDPTNASAFTGADFDGVHCDSCHRMYDPRFQATFDGTREGSDWAGYWDETNASGTPSSTAASATLTADRTEAMGVTFFNGNQFFGVDWEPVSAGWVDPGAGQYFVSATTDKRASFADATARHGFFYSRFHKSRYFCASCHDVSNPVLENLAFAGAAPGDGTTVLPSESASAATYFHVERTFSEFLLSAYGQGDGAEGSGFFDPASFATSHPGNRIATCQDCHMADRVGKGCDKADGILRPTGSVEHPQSGQPLHDLTGGNMLVPWILASTVSASPNYDSVNATLLGQGPAALTLDLTQGEGVDPAALLAGVDRAHANLQHAASIEPGAYDDAAATLQVRIVNHTGHKLISGFPEGRRMWLNVRYWSGGQLIGEVNPYDYAASTLRGLDTNRSPASPALGAGETHRDDLVYEVVPRSSLTGEDHTLHFVLADGRAKDNRIPPKGFRIAEAAARLAQPVWDGQPAPDYFTPEEYAGGYDEVTLALPDGVDGIELRLYYQTTSREYVTFLRDEINGLASTLASPTPSGEPSAYVIQTDPFFGQLAAWGDTIWQLWDHNRDVPGAAPVLMTSYRSGAAGSSCAVPGSDGAGCSDGNACTMGDACETGTCVAGPERQCPDTECRVSGACDPGTGGCVYDDLPDGTACSLGECWHGTCIDPTNTLTIVCQASPGQPTGPASPAGLALLLLGAVALARRAGRRMARERR